MTKIIMIHSFRRGVGRSTMIANIAALLALDGKRVGVIDMNIQSPTLHFLFHLSEAEIRYSLNNYLWQKCTLRQTIYNVTSRLPAPVVPGELFLIPATCQLENIARVLSNSYSMEALNHDIEALSDKLALDVLFLDPRSGLIETTLASIAISDTVVLLMRLDLQDYEGTGIMLDVVRKIGVAEMMLMVNEVPQTFEFSQVRKEVRQSLHYPVTALVPHSPELLNLGSRGIFAAQFPDSPVTMLYAQIAKKLLIV